MQRNSPCRTLLLSRVKLYLSSSIEVSIKINQHIKALHESNPLSSALNMFDPLSAPPSMGGFQVFRIPTVRSCSALKIAGIYIYIYKYLFILQTIMYNLTKYLYRPIKFSRFKLYLLPYFTKACINFCLVSVRLQSLTTKISDSSTSSVLLRYSTLQKRIADPIQKFYPQAEAYLFMTLMF